MHWNALGLANGDDFPDALSGGTMLLRYNSVMLLTPCSMLHPATWQKAADNADEIHTLFVIGGDNAVGLDARVQIYGAAGLAW